MKSVVFKSRPWFSIQNLAQISSKYLNGKYFRPCFHDRLAFGRLYFLNFSIRVRLNAVFRWLTVLSIVYRVFFKPPVFFEAQTWEMAYNFSLSKRLSAVEISKSIFLHTPWQNESPVTFVKLQSKENLLATKNHGLLQNQKNNAGSATSNWT